MPAGLIAEIHYEGLPYLLPYLGVAMHPAASGNGSGTPFGLSLFGWTVFRSAIAALVLLAILVIVVVRRSASVTRR
jgi:uncharacterized membrane protein